MVFHGVYRIVSISTLFPLRQATLRLHEELIDFTEFMRPTMIEALISENVGNSTNKNGMQWNL